MLYLWPEDVVEANSMTKFKKRLDKCIKDRSVSCSAPQVGMKPTHVDWEGVTLYLVFCIFSPKHLLLAPVKDSYAARWAFGLP